MSNFNEAFAQVVSLEGPFSNDPKDPGNWTSGKVGEGKLNGTKWGISAAAYPELDIKNLTKTQAYDIYLHDYWQRVRGDELPWPLSMFVFDAAVNQGVTAAVKLLQKSLGLVEDGRFGPKTLAAARTAKLETAALFMADRALRYMNTANWESFGRGWLKRLFVNAIKA